MFNWTATYRHDSDIVTPYEKFVAYNSLSDDDNSVNGVDLFEQTLTKTKQVRRRVVLRKSKLIIFSIFVIQKNYATGKSKMVAWFSSNCHAQNKRLEYARELSKHIEVDIFGRFGKR